MEVKSRIGSCVYQLKILSQKGSMQLYALINENNQSLKQKGNKTHTGQVDSFLEVLTRQTQQAI